MSTAATTPSTIPTPLKVACGLLVLQGAVLVALAVHELMLLNSTRLAMGLTTTATFAIFALAMWGAAWGMSRGFSPARSLAVAGQLIGLGVAWSFRGGETNWIALLVALVSLTILWGVFHPASLRALAPSADD